jgi:hypothetical protein
MEEKINLATREHIPRRPPRQEPYAEWTPHDLRLKVGSDLAVSSSEG